MSLSASHNIPRLVLASGSPRRRELLEKLGLRFTVTVSDLDESIDSSDPAFVVENLAEAKACAVGMQVATLHSVDLSPVLILGADTIVVLDNEILGKPRDKDDAVRMLKQLSGRSHQVFTGVSLVQVPGDSVRTIHTVTDVHFRDLDLSEIEAYVETGEPMDKAGAYALQGVASAFVRKIEGCYTNVIGLPVPDTVALLREHGVEVLGIGASRV